MLLCMGTCVSFVLMHDEIDAPKNFALLHDPSGRSWPSCSLLVSPMSRSGDLAYEEEITREARSYFGRGAKIRLGSLELPSRGFDKWTRVGPLREIYYERRGTRARGYFRHAFNRPRGMWRLIWPFKKAANKHAVLYRSRTSAEFRVELPQGCVVDDRGIVLP